MAIQSHITVVSQYIPAVYLTISKVEESAYKCHFLKGRGLYLWVGRAQNKFKIIASSHQSPNLSFYINSNC